MSESLQYGFCRCFGAETHSLSLATSSGNGGELDEGKDTQGLL